jgi:hypothetical protein
VRQATKDGLLLLVTFCRAGAGIRRSALACCCLFAVLFLSRPFTPHQYLLCWLGPGHTLPAPFATCSLPQFPVPSQHDNVLHVLCVLHLPLRLCMHSNH